jgi:Na+/proline symporter
MHLSRWLIFPFSIPVIVLAAQGYSVLYLFLLADLFCSAAAFPVFFGLFNRRYDGRTAILSTIGGLIAGLAVFPWPGEKPVHLLESFLLAALVPAAISAVLMVLFPARRHFDFAVLKTASRGLSEPV